MKKSRPSCVPVSAKRLRSSSNRNTPGLVNTVGRAIRMKGIATSERRNTRSSPTRDIATASHTSASIAAKPIHLPGGIDVVANMKPSAITNFMRASAL